MKDDFTTVVAVDQQHAAELERVWPSWRDLKPELLERPILLLADERLGLAAAKRLAAAREHPACAVAVVPDDKPDWSQRERMLAALTLMAPWLVHTEWLLKIDTDAHATAAGDWIPVGIDGTPCVLCASPWGYTKPADAIQRLDDWGDTVPELAGRPRLNLPFDPSARSVRTKGRFISWLCFGKTAWLRWAAGLCGKRLPVPSHDTLLSYICQRTATSWLPIRFKNFGWKHGRQ